MQQIKQTFLRNRDRLRYKGGASVFGIIATHQGEHHPDKYDSKEGDNLGELSGVRLGVMIVLAFVTSP